MLPALNNRYFGMRHGQSQGNVEGIVVSSPEIGLTEYGLTDNGRHQVQISAEQATQLGSDTIIVCSDFRRARETAEIVAEILGCDDPQSDHRLRERFFGIWDMKPNSSYATVWDKDALDPTQTIGNAESASRVCERIVDLLESIEMTYSNHTILLVSHGDPLHLAQTLFEDRCPSAHREVPNWQTAEIRELKPPL